MDDLLPCPFCGGKAQYDNSDSGPYEWISCTECGARSGSVNYNRTAEGPFSSATVMWNSRIEPEST